MTDIMETLEIVRQANPIPDPAATAEQRAVYGSLLTQIDRKSATISREQPARTASRRAAWVFAGAFLVVLTVIGVVALVAFRATESPPADVPVVTTGVPSTSLPPTSAVATSQVPVDGAPGEPLDFEVLLDESVPAYKTSLALASTGYPVVIAYMADGDIWEDEGPWEPTVSGIRLMRCTDPSCEAAPLITDLVATVYPGNLRIALDPADRPIVAYDENRDSFTLLFCDDPSCESFEERPVAEPDYLSFVYGGWAFTAEGHPVYTRSEGPWQVGGDAPIWVGSRLELVACRDRFCDAADVTAVDSGDSRMGASRPVIDSDGGVLLAYSVSEPLGSPDAEAGFDGATMYGTLRVAYCADVTCSDGLLVTSIDEGPDVGGGTIVVEADSPTVWYTAGREAVRVATGPDDEHLALTLKTFGKATCRNSSCSRFDLVRFGPLETEGTRPGGVPVLAHRLGDWAVTDSGTQLGLGRGDGEFGLLLIRWSESEPDRWHVATVAELNWSKPRGYFAGMEDAAMALGPGSLPLIAYTDSDGVHLIRCPDMGCVPP